MIVLDTTVLVYAVGLDHPLRAPCRALVAAIGEGRITATTTAEVIQEFSQVRAQRRDRADAARLAANYTDLLAPLLVVDDDDLRAGLDLFARSKRLGAFDSVLVATATRRRADGLVSVDRAFAGSHGVAHLDPAAPDFLTKIGVGQG